MNLQLSLKKKWFEMTKSGEKTEDYREITNYWLKRMFNVVMTCPITGENVDPYVYVVQNKDLLFKNSPQRNFKTNTMTLGYPKKTDTERILKLEHKGIEIRTGNPDWGAEPGKLYFVIKHGEVKPKTKEQKQSS